VWLYYMHAFSLGFIVAMFVDKVRIEFRNEICKNLMRRG